MPLLEIKHNPATYISQFQLDEVTAAQVESVHSGQFMHTRTMLWTRR